MTMTEPVAAQIVAYDMADLKDRDPEAWHGWRARGVGSSDVGKILGVSSYGTAWSVFHWKTGRIAAPEQTEAMYWGTMLEPVIAARWQQDHPDVEMVNPDAMYAHRGHGWALAQPDRLAGDDGIVEIKTAAQWVADKWEDGNIPDEYGYQMAWQMFVLDRAWADLAVLIGGNTYRTYRFERSHELDALLLERMSAFWRLVQDDTPPAVVAADRVVDLYPEEDYGEIVNVGADIVREQIRSNNLRDRIKDLEVERKEAQNRIREAIGTAETAMHGDRVVATWKTNKSGVRTLNIKEA